MNSGNYESKILEAIQIVVDNAISNANYDKTIQATVVRCEDATIGDYIIRYQDSTFHAYSYNTDTTYTNGSIVYVLVPGGDFKLEKTIIGSVDKLGPDYVSIVEGEDAYEIVGTNTISNTSTFSLCSYKETDVKVLYNRDAGIDLLNLNTFAIAKYIKESNSLICGATFKTALSIEQRFQGDYGVIFSLDFKDNGTGEIVTKDFLVDINKMTGNPYNYTTASRQYGIFDIDGVNFDSIKRISIFAYDFPQTAENKDDDIFISNIELCGATLIEPDLVASSMLSIITPQGTYFDDQDLDSATRELQAQVKIKGKAINNKSQLVNYYWFIENGEVDSQHAKYNRYGGKGWACLNDFNSIEGNSVEWVPASYKYVISKKLNIAKETKYKCVAVYNNNTVLSKTIVIYNYSSPYDISIISDSGVQFYYDLGSPTLTCLINGTEETSDDYKYVWSSVNQNNDFGVLKETSDINEIYNNAVESYNALIKQIEEEQILKGSVQTQLNEYQAIIRMYENTMRIEDNHIYKLSINTITGFTTFKCSVYKNGTLIGTASIIITNSLENNNEYKLIINNGNQVFKYNEKGTAPTSLALDNPLVILPLSFSLYDNKGQLVESDAIRGEDIQWIFPRVNTLLEITTSQDVTKQDTYYVYTGERELNFDIKNKYNASCLNNSIELNIQYKDMVLSAHTNFTFIKEGEIGSNGTDFICKIVPNVADGKNVIDYPMITYNEATGQST